MPFPSMVIGVLSPVWLLHLGSKWTMRVFFNVYLDTILGASTPLIGALLAAGQLRGPAQIAGYAPLDFHLLGIIVQIEYVCLGAEFPK